MMLTEHNEIIFCETTFHEIRPTESFRAAFVNQLEAEPYDRSYFIDLKIIEDAS